MVLHYILILILSLCSILGWGLLFYTVITTQKCRQRELNLITDIHRDLELAKQELEELK